MPVEGAFTYRVPDPLEGSVEPGARVRVRFAGRRVIGIVVAVSKTLPADTDAGRVRLLDDVLDRRPLLSPLMLELADRIAAAYLVGIGEVLQLALPSGGDPVAVHRNQPRSRRLIRSPVRYQPRCWEVNLMICRVLVSRSSILGQ